MFTHLVHDAPPASLVVSLTHEQRRRARQRVTLADGGVLEIALRRGVVLRDGDVLASDDGRTVLVRAADEDLSIATTPDPHLLARAAYHLGNRHVPLQIEPGRLSYPHDHVLDGMCRELGLEVRAARGPFEPELGGYGASHGHHHHE